MENNFPFTIRLDVLFEDEFDKDLLTKYVDKYEKYLVYEEVSNKTKKLHYQGIVWVTDLKAFNAAKTRFTTMFKETHPRSNRSMAPVRKDNYEVYITKDLKKVMSRGYTDEEIERLQSQSYSKEDRTGNTRSQYENIINYLRDRGIHDTSSGWDICEKLIEYYRDTRKCEPNDFQLRNMTKSIYTQLQYERAVRLNRPDVYENYVKARAKQIIGHEWIF